MSTELNVAATFGDKDKEDKYAVFFAALTSCTLVFSDNT